METQKVHSSPKWRAHLIIAAAVAAAVTVLAPKVLAEEPILGSRVKAGAGYAQNSNYTAWKGFTEGKLRVNENIVEFNADGTKNDKGEVAVNAGGGVSMQTPISAYPQTVSGAVSYLEGIYSNQSTYSVGANFSFDYTGNIGPAINLTFGNGDVMGAAFTTSGLDVGIVWRRYFQGVGDIRAGMTWGSQAMVYPGAVIEVTSGTVSGGVGWGFDLMEWNPDEGAFGSVKFTYCEVYQEQTITVNGTVKAKPGVVDAVEGNVTIANVTNPDITFTEFTVGGRVTYKGIIGGVTYIKTAAGSGVEITGGYSFTW